MLKKTAATKPRARTTRRHPQIATTLPSGHFLFGWEACGALAFAGSVWVPGPAGGATTTAAPQAWQNRAPIATGFPQLLQNIQPRASFAHYTTPGDSRHSLEARSE